MFKTIANSNLDKSVNIQLSDSPMDINRVIACTKEYMDSLRQMDEIIFDGKKGFVSTFNNYYEYMIFPIGFTKEECKEGIKKLITEQLILKNGKLFNNEDYIIILISPNIIKIPLRIYTLFEVKQLNYFIYDWDKIIINKKKIESYGRMFIDCQSINLYTRTDIINKLSLGFQIIMANIGISKHAVNIAFENAGIIFMGSPFPVSVGSLNKYIQLENDLDSIIFYNLANPNNHISKGTISPFELGTAKPYTIADIKAAIMNVLNLKYSYCSLINKVIGSYTSIGSICKSDSDRIDLCEKLCEGCTDGKIIPFEINDFKMLKSPNF